MDIVAAKYRVVSGSWFKLLAVISMAIDHTALFILRYIPQYNEPLLLLNGRELSLYALMRLFGRIAFPLFAFFVVEGFIHTRNRRRYALNLAIFALISEIPWQLLHSAPFYATHSVMPTLLIGVLGMAAMEHFSNNAKQRGIALISLLVLSFLLRADYGALGYGFIVMLYALRRERALQIVAGTAMFWRQPVVFLTLCTLLLYNGERGFIRSTFAKYLFYAFYPLHLFIIYVVRHFVL